MAKLDSFIYCLNAERVIRDGKEEGINALGILSNITPEYVPGAFSFSIIFSILDVDIEVENEIQIILKNDKQNELVNTGVIKLPGNTNQENSEKLPEQYRGLNLSLDFRNVIFEENGEYKTAVYFNGSLLSEKSVYVKGKR